MNDPKEIIALLYEDVVDFHNRLEQSHEKIRSGVRDAGLIESAVNAPFQSCFGQEAYPSIFEKAAHLGYFLAKNHGFEDGNKRTALHSMLLFLLVNDIELDYTQKEIEDLICDVAENKISVGDLTKWLESRARE